MKKKIPFLIAAGIVPLAATAGEQSFSDHLYLNGDIGPSFVQQTRIRNADTMDFNIGLSADVAVGYQATPWLAGELATGVIWNSVDKIGGVPISSFGSGLDLYQVPVMGNIVLTAPFWQCFKPYVGAGVGGVAATVNFERPLGSVRDTDFTFSFQAFAGLKYELSQRVELGLGYRFLQTEEHNWVENGVALDTESTSTHTVTASFTWRF